MAYRSTTRYTQDPGAGNESYNDWYRQLLALQQGALAERIPQGAELEASSSEAIAGLLAPGDFFPDTARQSAELSAGRGVTGSPAAASLGVRMTADEQLRRMALGQEMLSAATARNPIPTLPDIGQFKMSPYQAELLRLQAEELELKKRAQYEATREAARNRSRSSLRSVGSPNLSVGSPPGWTGTMAPDPWGGGVGDTFGTGEDRSTWNTVDNPYLDTFTTGLGGVPQGTTIGPDKYWNWE